MSLSEENSERKDKLAGYDFSKRFAVLSERVRNFYPPARPTAQKQHLD